MLTTTQYTQVRPPHLTDTHTHTHTHTHTVLEILAQCQMVWMLLSMSVGWTLGSQTAHPVRDKKQLGTITAVAALHVSQLHHSHTRQGSDTGLGGRGRGGGGYYLSDSQDGLWHFLTFFVSYAKKKKTLE